MSTRRLSLSSMFSIGALLGVAVTAPVQIRQESVVVVTTTVCSCSMASSVPDLVPITSTPVTLAPQSTVVPVQDSVSSMSSVVTTLGLPTSIPIPVASTTMVPDILPESTTSIPMETSTVAPIPASGTTGQAIIKNTCAFDVLVQSVAGSEVGSVVSLPPGDIYSENYHNGPNGSGVAIKCIKHGEDWSAPMLLEYSPNTDMGLIFYDMSVSVGGNMQGHGGIGNTYVLNPSIVGQGSACVPVSYANSYVHLGESDYATKSCPISTSITLNLC